jgi:hypothetical protein
LAGIAGVTFLQPARITDRGYDFSETWEEMGVSVSTGNTKGSIDCAQKGEAHSL